MSDAVVPHKAETSPRGSDLSSAGWLRRTLDSDLFYSFRQSKLTMIAAAVTVLFFLLAIFASVLSVQDPFDPAQLQLINSRIPPLWETRPEDFPLAGEVLDLATGLIVHSHHVHDCARAAGFAGPIDRKSVV